LKSLLKEHFLKNIPLKDEQWNFISEQFHSKKFKKKEYIIRKDEAVSEIYFINSGLVKLSVDDQNGNEHIISFACEDWWETDFEAFYTQKRATQNLKCIEETEVLALSYQDYLKILKTIPEMTEFFLMKAVNGHIANQKRILSLMTFSAQKKYEEFVKSYPQIIQRIPKTTLALYLGVSRETLSRFFSESQKL